MDDGQLPLFLQDPFGDRGRKDALKFQIIHGLSLDLLHVGIVELLARGIAPKADPFITVYKYCVSNGLQDRKDLLQTDIQLLHRSDHGTLLRRGIDFN